ncbi:pyruvate kinase cytosolic isozyme [Phtheirospermum japonicum]|uniref:Pyruvate kinase n=1 Tax=Phtheirospermum japonicum TaxID=374723 RepID=A0A830B6T6_9LAMI|nr:pyruvate kinase cytosolic isozyme [Phtheirospermum japonicum]
MGHLNVNEPMFCSNYSVANGKQDTIMMSMIPCFDQRPKTKIVCTLGPSSRSVETIEKLLKAGMNVARFNFSHGSHAYHQETLDNLRAAIRNTGILCAVMLDTKLAHDLKPQSVILCSDGTISLTVLECNKELGLVRCRCENAAVLGERKNVNLPGVVVDLPTLTNKDMDDILLWGLPNKIDIIALSFVRKGSDLVEVRNLLGNDAKSIILMSKVENQEGVSNFDEILANSDAFMVARGDLGMEIPIEKIFLAQKMMIKKCNLQGKPVVTATQMFESMIKAPRPTRAEATDVANAVIDGTDCVMLSGETAAGAHPVIAVETMAKICAEAENNLEYGQIFRKAVDSAHLPMSPLESLACTAVQAASSAGAVMIMVMMGPSKMERLVSKYRPSVPIVSVGVVGEFRAEHGLVSRGVVPMLVCSFVVEEMLKEAKAKGLCGPGDSVVMVQHCGNRAIHILTDRPSQDSVAGANSEKELGNVFFKQQKFNEAIDCYSRSIALSPTAIAYGNRAMAYLKIRRFQEAENDCNEAVNLDRWYVKAYSRRSIAKKELGKLKEAVDDAELALILEPTNQEVKKQYAAFKSLLNQVDRSKRVIEILKDRPKV